MTCRVLSLTRSIARSSARFRMQGSFALLMWKNAKLHQRRPKGTFAQIMLPVAFVGILWLVRNLTAVNKEIMCER